MTKIVAIGTAVPEHQHPQQDILEFMQRVYAMDEAGNRKLRFLYRQAGIDQRYSVIPDYGLPADKWQFFPASENLEPFPDLEKRMEWFARHAGALSRQSIKNCLSKTPQGDDHLKKVTHLITVSCTGMSAPGLELELLQTLGLAPTVQRQSINFMGCYAAVLALKMADAFCKADPASLVLVVCTELCTLHFQRETSPDSLTSSMLFGDGSAALLIAGDKADVALAGQGLQIDGFYSVVSHKGAPDMSWKLSSKGFLMTLSSYVPSLIEQDFQSLTDEALAAAGIKQEDIAHWCIHPGGRKILEAVQQSLGLDAVELRASHDVLRDYGNMSSPSVLFVLERILSERAPAPGERVYGAAFGPGLTMETFLLTA